MNLTFPMSTSLSIAFQVTSKERESSMSIAGWNYCLVEFRREYVLYTYSPMLISFRLVVFCPFVCIWN